MNYNDAGFTLMEVLLSVAIILILGSVLVISSNTAMHGIAKSNETVNTAEVITGIDRLIRQGAHDIQIPYWANPAPYIDNYISDLFRSKAGPYIKSIRVISDNAGNARGIEVSYIVNNREMLCLALFSSAVIVGMKP